MELLGTYYPHGSMAGQAARLQVDEAGLVLLNGISIGDWRSLKVSDRLSSVTRKIELPDGGLFETDNNNGIDQIEMRLRGEKAAFSLIADRLEQSWRFAALSIVAVVASVYVLVAYAVPAVATGIAFAMPDEVLRPMGDRVLAGLDKHVFEDTELSRSEQDRAHELFAQINAAARARGRTMDGVKLHLRKGPERMGANAFALPGGHLIVVDALWELADGDDEVAGVIAHEIGHAARRHNLQNLIRAGLLSFGFVAFLGDPSGVADILVAAPVAFLSADYSREFEREADKEAVETLHAMGIDPNRFGDMLARLSGQCEGPCREGGLLASHPATADRIEAVATQADQLGW